LNALAVKFLLYQELSALHFLDSFFYFACWALAKHWRESAKELYGFILCHFHIREAMQTRRALHASSSRRREGSHNSHATFFKSEQVLNRSCASGWNTENTVVSLSDMIMSLGRKFQAYDAPEMDEGTFKNDADYPQLLFRRRTVIDTLEYFGLHVST